MTEKAAIGSPPRLDYDQLAADYARHRQVHPGVFESLVSHARLSAESRVLEVGCGTGNYACALRKTIGCTVVGIDPSGAMLERARARDESITWLVGQGEQISGGDGLFDLVYSVDVIHHIIDRDRYFRQAKRVLKPGGMLCTATDSEEDIPRRRPLTNYFPETVPVELERYPRVGTLRREMESAGFGSVETSHTEFEYLLDDIEGYRNRAFSSLHLITDEAHDRGIALMERDLNAGAIPCLSLYTLIWGRARFGSVAASPPNG